VVINADCDLAHGKVDGVLALLPIFSFHSYLEAFWVKSHLLSEFSQNIEWILGACGIEKAEAEDLARWIESDNPMAIASSLIGAHAVPTKKHAELHQRVNKCAIIASSQGLEGFKRVCSLDPDPSRYARKHIEAAKGAIGDGHFFLSEISGQEGLGFVVRMRRILSIEATNCYRSVSDMRAHAPDTKTSAARVARLTPTYQHRIAQLFAYQFSRIGLPDETTELSKLAVDDIVSLMAGAQK